MHSEKQRGVDVAARQHGADDLGATDVDPPVHEGGDGHGAGPLDDELRALQQQHHRLRHLVVGDRHDLVDVALDDRQREVAGALDGDAVADRVGRARPTGRRAASESM